MNEPSPQATNRNSSEGRLRGASSRIRKRLYFDFFLVGYLLSGLIVVRFADRITPGGLAIVIGVCSLCAGLLIGSPISRLFAFFTIGAAAGSMAIVGFDLFAVDRDPNQPMGPMLWALGSVCLAVARVIAEVNPARKYI